MRAGLVAVLALAGACAAASAPAGDLRVRHGEGNGRLQLGMTLAQVRGVLGRPDALAHREPRSGGRLYIEYQWDFAWWSVSLLGRPGRLRVVKIASVDRTQRTPENLGIGNTVAQLYKKVRPLRCIDVYAPSGPPTVTHSECIHTLPNGRQTVFIFDRRGGFGYDPDQHVAAVEVRARGCDFYGRNCARSRTVTVLEPLSASTPAANARIRHGTGIGRLCLGMSLRQVRHILGSPEAVSRRGTRRGGRIYVEYQWGLGWWRVGLLGPRGKLRVVKIATESRRQRTPENLGVGNTPRQLYAGLPDLRCKDVYVLGRVAGWVLHTECVHRLPNGRQTVFIIRRGAGLNDPAITVAVEVRARGCDYYGRNCSVLRNAAELVEAAALRQL